MQHLVLDLKRDGPMMALSMIEVGKGEVAEIQARVDSVNHRKPTHAELVSVGKILGGKKDLDSTLTREQYTRLQERMSALQKRASDLKIVDRFNTERIAELEKDIVALRERQIDADAMAVVAISLEIRIEELAMAGDLAGYARTKEVYEQLTGRSWVDEDE